VSDSGSKNRTCCLLPSAEMESSDVLGDEGRKCIDACVKVAIRNRRQNTETELFKSVPVRLDEKGPIEGQKYSSGEADEENLNENITTANDAGERQKYSSDEADEKELNESISAAYGARERQKYSSDEKEFDESISTANGAGERQKHSSDEANEKEFDESISAAYGARERQKYSSDEKEFDESISTA